MEQVEKISNGIKGLFSLYNVADFVQILKTELLGCIAILTLLFVRPIIRLNCYLMSHNKHEVLKSSYIRGTVFVHFIIFFTCFLKDS